MPVTITFTRASMGEVIGYLCCNGMVPPALNLPARVAASGAKDTAATEWCRPR